MTIIIYINAPYDHDDHDYNDHCDCDDNHDCGRIAMVIV